jgi:streptogramin lyase
MNTFYWKSVSLVAALAALESGVFAQSGSALGNVTPVRQVAPTNDAPNPYRTIDHWVQMPPGRTFGASAGVGIDSKGHIWVAERCGANSCADSKLDPIFEFDASGKVLRNFGGGMFVFPHGLAVDKDDNVWVTDGQGREGQGHQVFKFSPEGKVLMTLGKAGVPGTTEDTFNMPSSVAIAANGDIFVGDGHGGMSNNRIVKFDKNGKYIKEWGRKGTGPGEFDQPHTMAFDSRGRLFVGDRNNNRIQIFNQDGKFLDEWPQFSRPSGVYIDKKDVIYVADSESESVAKNHDGWKRGIRIGSARTGAVTAFIPDPVEKITGTSAAEGVAADSKGVIYGAEVGPRDLKRYVKK